MAPRRSIRSPKAAHTDRGARLRSISLGAALAAVLGCRSSPPPPRQEVIDIHVHLTHADAVTPLLAHMAKHRIDRAVILASPDLTSGRGGSGLAGYRTGNDIVLDAAAAHPGKLIPFVTVDLGHGDLAYLAELRRRGACGVKLYQGHNLFHERPLDDPSHQAMWQALSDQALPILLHANTVRYRDELEAVLRSFPDLRLVCAHLCGSRTDLARVESLMEAFPRLLVDTSHGSAGPAAEGFANLERERAQLLKLFSRWPERFLFGTDLVTSGLDPLSMELWDLQVESNMGLLKEDNFRFFRQTADQPARTLGTYQGLHLPPELLGPALGQNAARWLGACAR
ncbi:amidohydrolase family protein [Sorangium sp. So ce394]|uniref:amidohydrolase family protein n=1 Tax=Sorangium sp. So ce394 TaxID=3133310 RepID=UPI003F5B5A42